MRSKADRDRIVPHVANLDARESTGKVYYDSGFRRLLESIDNPSIVDRVTTWYFARRWPGYALLILAAALLGLSIVAATWQLR